MMRLSQVSHSLSSIGWIASLLAACGPAGDAPPTNAWTAWTIDPDPVAAIGGMDGDTPYLFSRIAAVRLLPDGRIAVADASSSTIRLFDANGRFERQMGRRGQGPGELTNIRGMWISSPDTIVVYDSGNRRLSRFLLSGEFLTGTTFRADDGRPEVYLGPIGPNTHAIYWISILSRGSSVLSSDSVRLGRFDQGRLQAVLGTFPGMRRVSLEGPPAMHTPIAFSPHFVAAMVGDTIFHSNGLGSLIQATGPDGQVVRSIRLPLDSWESEEAYARLEPLLDGRSLGWLREMRELPGTDTIPTISDLLTGQQGRLWVKRYDPATDNHLLGRRRTGGIWMVIGTDGSVIAEVAVPVGFRLMEVGPDRVAGVMRDEFDVERVLVLNLSRG